VRILVVTMDFPPPETGGYGIMAARVCGALAERGHQLLVLTVADTAPATQPPLAPGVEVRRVLESYYAGGECRFPPLAVAAAIERGNLAALESALAEHQPQVVSFWHMGAMSLNLITWAAARGFPLTFVIGDDWLVYGTWADGWHRRFLPDYQARPRRYAPDVHHEPIHNS
jgi:Glycosyl transferase 4-like domain